MGRRCSVVEEYPRMKRSWRLLRAISKTPALLLIGLVRVYQILVSPLLGVGSPILGWGCRFHPSCSVYFIESVRKYGAIRGALAGHLADLPLQPLEPRRLRSAVMAKV